MDADDLARIADDYPNVYVGDDEPRYPPAECRGWPWMRHCLVQGYFGVQLWYQGSRDGEKWFYLARSDV